MGFDVSNIQTDALKAKATVLTAKGMIGLSVQIYEVTSSSGTISLLEVEHLYI